MWWKSTTEVDLLVRYKSEEEADVLIVCLVFIDANRLLADTVVTSSETVSIERVAVVSTETRLHGLVNALSRANCPWRHVRLLFARRADRHSHQSSRT